MYSDKERERERERIFGKLVRSINLELVVKNQLCYKTLGCRNAKTRTIIFMTHKFNNFFSSCLCYELENNKNTLLLHRLGDTLAPFFLEDLSRGKT